MANGIAIPEDMAALPRYGAWRRRRMQPALMLKIAQAPWADAENLPDYRGWLKVAKRRDPKGWTDRDPRYYMTRHLVDEVLFAAGGLERELNSLKDSVNSAQACSDSTPGERQNSGAEQPKLVLNSALHATYAFINALTWGRAVRERVERADPTENRVGFMRSLLQRKAKRSSPVRVNAGLLPSLADGQLKRTLQKCLQELDPFLQESRRMANYALHAGAPYGPSTPTFEVRSDRQVFLPIPDKGTKRVAIWDDFTYRDGRDAVSYIQTLFDAVARFVDRMLDAFDALPEPF
ncbi:hypothetical protein [Streptomyces sp. NPDC055287]